MHTGANVALFCAMAVEAFLNDFALMSKHLVKPDDPPAIGAAHELLVMLEKSRVGTRVKYALLYYTLAGRTLPRGEALSQNFEALLKVRDAIVHRKAYAIEWDKTGATVPDQLKTMLRYFEERGLLARPLEMMPDHWTMLLDESLAFSEWALDTAQRTIKNIGEVTPSCMMKRGWLDSMFHPTSSLVGGQIWH